MEIRTIATAGYNFYSEVIEPAYVEIILPEVDTENLQEIQMRADNYLISPSIGAEIVDAYNVNGDDLVGLPKFSSGGELVPKLIANVIE